jgi:predicted O-methyltransferase YrrM
MDTKLDALLKELEAVGEENDARVTDHSRKMLNITPDTGEFLLLLVRALKAKRVLELGTSNGYSTLWLAHAVQAIGGSVTTVELLPFKAEMARENFRRASLERWIHPHLGDSTDYLKRQSEPFDLIFLDGNRAQYVGWWNDLQRLLNPSGLIVADNAVSHTEELRPFVQLVQQTRNYLTSTVPVGNGEFLVLKQE